MTDAPLAALLAPTDDFVRRHLGPGDADLEHMLAALGYDSLEALTVATVPESILLKQPLELAPSRGESDALGELRTLARGNTVLRSHLGMGYHDTLTPPVILRNVLENPGWYTQYTPYQAEIAQGRLEALLNFQTMVSELTALPLAGASLLDEGTAAAEAMAMCHALRSGSDERTRFFVSDRCHPQTIGVVKTRGESLHLEVVVGPLETLEQQGAFCGVLVQYPDTDGEVKDWRSFCAKQHGKGALVVMATDLLALTLLAPPGELGADIAVGSAQRFGVPMGYGGPHAAFIATHNDNARRMPGRIIGVSKDAQGNLALRMALQTREQHIRRDKATSNICTAQALLAIIAGFYAAWHGPRGLTKIATRVRALTVALREGLTRLGHTVLTQGPLFDTVRVRPNRDASAVLAQMVTLGANLRDYGDGTLGVSLDETTTASDVQLVWEAFSPGKPAGITVEQVLTPGLLTLPEALARTSTFLTHPVFNTHHSETGMLRYISRLQSRDLSLAQAMIPLGSCTMKLNATSEMIPVTWPEFGRMHPFCPPVQAAGYHKMFAQLEDWLAEITGFAAVSLQPNAGSQGEYAGLLAVRAYHRARGQAQRDVCLIPDSAHGTNPASAVIAGFRVVPVKCDARGNIEVEDLRAKAAAHADRLGALMVTYPSTHGVFEESIREICEIVHAQGGQVVYMDGANMNAQVGLCRPGDIGADVCHLNLHKTFCIPHGGGGPGMGPICVAKHLAPYLPSHAVQAPGGTAESPVGAVASAPYGSPSILVISWMYIAMMGGDGLRKATQVAILNANYLAHRLSAHFKILYTGRNGRCAHEFILDCRAFEQSAGVKVEDVAKRLMDYGFHGPTMSWPVPGTLMIEPTESEPLSELDRLCDAFIAIRAELREIEEGRMDRKDNPLRNAPHTMAMVGANEWSHPYGREQAAYPVASLRGFKFWPAVARVDNTYGDRNLVCLCPPMSDYQ